MEGVTTAIVLFLLACLIVPSLVRNKTQYYAALVSVLLIILFEAISRFAVPVVVEGVPARPSGLWVFCHVAIAVLQVVGLILLVLAAGGLSVKELAGDLARAYEVIRRGEEEKEIIIPIGEQRSKAAAAAPGDKAPERVEIAGDQAAGWPKKKDEERSSLPLE